MTSHCIWSRRLGGPWSNVRPVDAPLWKEHPFEHTYFEVYNEVGDSIIVWAKSKGDALVTSREAFLIRRPTVFEMPIAEERVDHNGSITLMYDGPDVRSRFILNNEN